jgi:hypothetical protein
MSKQQMTSVIRRSTWPRSAALRTSLKCGWNGGQMFTLSIMQDSRLYSLSLGGKIAFRLLSASLLTRLGQMCPRRNVARLASRYADL